MLFTKKNNLIESNSNMVNALLPVPVMDSNIIEVEAEELPQYATNPFVWDVVERPVYNQHGKQIHGFKELVRSDNGLMLNVCKESYTPTTNAKLMETVENLQQITGFQLQEYREFKGGKIVLAFLQNTSGMQICGHDYNTYMIVGNSHNYKSAFFIGEHSTMIRCSNQFHQVAQNLKAYHTSNNALQIDQIVSFYQQYSLLKDNTIQLMQHFAQTRTDGKVKDKLVRELLQITPDTAFNELSTRKQNIIDNLNESIHTETKALGQNMFGLFNGVTHWTTHQRQQAEPIYSNIFGSNNEYNQKAMRFGQELLH